MPVSSEDWGAVFVAKYDSSCGHLWSKRFDGGIPTFDRAGGVFITRKGYLKKNTWLDATGAVIAELDTIPYDVIMAFDPKGGIAVGWPPGQIAVGGGIGGGIQMYPGSLSRLDPHGNKVWGFATVTPTAVAIDPDGDVVLVESGLSVSKFKGATGQRMWCLLGPEKWSTVAIDDDGTVRLAAALDTTVDVLGDFVIGLRAAKADAPAPATDEVHVDVTRRLFDDERPQRLDCDLAVGRRPRGDR